MPVHLSSLIILIILFLSVFSVKNLVSFFNSGNILGTETWIAKGGDDNSGSGSSGSSGSGSSNDSSNDNSGSGGSDRIKSGSGSSDSVSSITSGSSGGGSGENYNSVGDSDSLSLPASTYGECEGPDGMKFNTNFSTCNDLNKSWGVSSFEFEKIQVKQVIKPSSSDDNNENENKTEDDLGVRIKTEKKEGDQRTEIKISETERIRARTKDGRARIDITSGGVKTRLQYEDGRVIVKAEQEGLDGVELEDNSILKIDDRLAKSAIKISTSSAELFLVQRGTAAVQTDFPISIDLATNTLSVSTQTGLKTLTILPDQVIANLLVARIVSRFDSTQLSDRFQTGELAAVSDLLTLLEHDENLVYEIRGISDQKFLGFIPISIEKGLTISAETGEVISEETGYVDKLLDIFSL